MAKHASAVVSAEPGQLPFVSVIVPARDESDVITNCISSILANDYPEDLFELIVVDDLSRDNTAEVVQHMISHTQAATPVGFGYEEEDESRVRLLQMPENLQRARAHKKRAIAKGIEAARGDIILTTDADCTLPTSWIRTMAAAFDTPRVAFVSGPVHIRDRGDLWSGVQALEFLGLTSFGAGGIGVGRPNLCNGANVAYRRDVFNELGGFGGIDHLTSGDDELLMQKIAYETAHEVRFCALPEGAVITEPLDSLGAFAHQRRRWASKGAHYPHRPLVVQAVLIYLFCLLLLGSTLALPFTPGFLPYVAVAFLLKTAAEASVLIQAAKQYRLGRLLRYLPVTQILHLPYIVFLGAAGALGGYEWKGRSIER